ncbi:MAG: pantetheine-phosphate adenylyltransferase [Candidatus Marinimicrobia bacterium]|nr:pantetheine-phosphate adenylyltransferase [Candidatus Neomarinimicrobiota bacterium]
MRKIAIYPGSFDPITNGHIDILKRAAGIFDLVYIAVAVNLKKDVLFNSEERLEMIEKSIKGIENVKVEKFSGLTVEFAKKVGAIAIVRGLRAISDFEYEFQMALMNKHLNPDIDTIFLMAHQDYSYLSSSVVKELAKLGADVSKFVPELVNQMLRKKFRGS